MADYTFDVSTDPFPKASEPKAGSNPSFPKTGLSENSTDFASTYQESKQHFYGRFR